MTTLQYAISDIAGRVLGFVKSESMPVLTSERVAHVMIEPVDSFPEPSSPTKVLYIANGVLDWVETATLAAIRERKRAEITAARLHADADHFLYTYTYLGAAGVLVTETKAIRTADKDMFDILTTGTYVGMFDELPEDWPGGWKAIDESYVRIATVAEFKPFLKTMYRAGIANFMWSQQLKAMLETAETVEQINAINW